MVVTWFKSQSVEGLSLLQYDSSFGECVCNLKKDVNSYLNLELKKKNPSLFLQVPSDTNPTLHLVCAVRPRPAAQLGARPKVCFSHLLSILGFYHVVRFSTTCKNRHSVYL